MVRVGIVVRLDPAELPDQGDILYKVSMFENGFILRTIRRAYVAGVLEFRMDDSPSVGKEYVIPVLGDAETF